MKNISSHPAILISWQSSPSVNFKYNTLFLGREKGQLGRGRAKNSKLMDNKAGQRLPKVKNLGLGDKKKSLLIRTKYLCGMFHHLPLASPTCKGQTFIIVSKKMQNVTLEPHTPPPMFWIQTRDRKETKFTPYSLCRVVGSS